VRGGQEDVGIPEGRCRYRDSHVSGQGERPLRGARVGRVHGLQKTQGDPAGLRLTGVPEKHSELVRANPSQNVLLTEVAAQEFGGVDEEAVAYHAPRAR